MSAPPTTQPHPSPPPVSDRVPIGLELLFALVAAVIVAALGAPLGWLWSRVAPQVELVQTQYGPYPVEGEPEGYFADDGWFVLMAIGLGILVAVAAWLLLRRYRGPIVLAGLVVGSAAASVIAAWLGNKIGSAHYQDLVAHAPVDTHIFRPAKLRTGTSSLAFGFLPWVRGTMLIQALAAAAVYTGLAGFHASPTLRYETMPEELLDPAPDPAAALGEEQYRAWLAAQSPDGSQPSQWAAPDPGAVHSATLSDINEMSDKHAVDPDDRSPRG